MKRLLFLTIIISSLFLFLFTLPNKNQVLAANCASPNYCNFTCGGYGSTTDTCANGNTCCKSTVCTNPTSCRSNNPNPCCSGFRCSVNEVGTVIGTCVSTSTCTAPADCSHSNLQGCVSGYSDADGVCTGIQKCCKKDVECATLGEGAACKSTSFAPGGGVCGGGYTSVDGGSCPSGNSCCRLDEGTMPPCNIKDGCNEDGTYKLKCGYDPKNPTAALSCDTAIGKIEIKPQDFIKGIFAVVLSLVGGIAVLLIIISGYKLATSRGNPDQVKGAQEQLTAAIIGLLFVIFSLVFLEVIGINILGLPPSVFQ